MQQNIIEVNLDDFPKQVLKRSHQHPVLVDFWAEWCAPCLVIAPVLAQLAKEAEGALIVAKIEVDHGENMKLAGRYQVRGFPTVILFLNGEIRGRFSGAKPLAYIQDFLAREL